MNFASVIITDCNRCRRPPAALRLCSLALVMANETAAPAASKIMDNARRDDSDALLFVGLAKGSEIQPPSGEQFGPGNPSSTGNSHPIFPCAPQLICGPFMP